MTDAIRVEMFDGETPLLVIDDIGTRNTYKYKLEAIPKMNKPTRRTTLAMLGLAPPTTAVGMETFLEDKKLDGPRAAGSATNAQIATALRSLADNIDAGRIMTVKIDVNCSLAANTVVQHTVSVDFVYCPDREVTS